VIPRVRPLYTTPIPGTASYSVKLAFWLELCQKFAFCLVIFSTKHNYILQNLHAVAKRLVYLLYKHEIYDAQCTITSLDGELYCGLKQMLPSEWYFARYFNDFSEWYSSKYFKRYNNRTFGKFFQHVFSNRHKFQTSFSQMHFLHIMFQAGCLTDLKIQHFRNLTASVTKASGFKVVMCFMLLNLFQMSILITTGEIFKLLFQRYFSYTNENKLMRTRTFFP